MTEIKVGVNDFGTLFAIFPDGKIRTILIDVHDTAHYGIARIGAEKVIVTDPKGDES